MKNLNRIFEEVLRETSGFEHCGDHENFNGTGKEYSQPQNLRDADEAYKNDEISYEEYCAIYDKQ